MSTISSTFTKRDLARIEAESFVQTIEYHRELPSTSDRAQQRAKAGQAYSPPLLILTEMQTAGRGRNMNRWWSTPGALTFSLLCDLSDLKCSRECLPQVSLVTALAVCAGLRKLDHRSEFRLKWPNDVYIMKRKVAGILLEPVPLDPHGLVVGIGINVNNSLNTAPPDVRAVGTSMCDVHDERYELTTALIHVLNQLAAHYAKFAKGWLRLKHEWGPYCLLSGRTVCVTTGERQISGLCHGIDLDGALIVQNDEGRQRLYSGSVEQFD